MLLSMTLRVGFTWGRLEGRRGVGGRRGLRGGERRKGGGPGT